MVLVLMGGLVVVMRLFVLLIMWVRGVAGVDVVVDIGDFVGISWITILDLSVCLFRSFCCYFC